MFFNKLKEKLKEYLKVKLLKFAKNYTEDICESIKISHKTTEELIAKYKHTKWEELTPFEATTLISKFDLVEDSHIGKYVGKNTCFMPWHYVGDTLQSDKERKEEFRKFKKPAPHAPLNNEKVALAKIKAIANNQKSTVKAVKAIKEVLKDVE